MKREWLQKSLKWEKTVLVESHATMISHQFKYQAPYYKLTHQWKMLFCFFLQKLL